MSAWSVVRYDLPLVIQLQPSSTSLPLLIHVCRCNRELAMIIYGTVNYGRQFGNNLFKWRCERVAGWRRGGAAAEFVRPRQ